MQAQEEAEGLQAEAILENEQRFECRIVELHDDVLVFEADWMHGRGQVLLNSLRRLAFTARAAETGPDRLALTNGDVLVGTVSAMDAKTIHIKNDTMGELSLPRTLVTNIMHAGAGGLLINSEFSLGNMGPWKAVQGDWKARDGLLKPDGGEGYVTAKAEQSGSMTITATFDAGERRCSSTMTFYMDRPRSLERAPLMLSLSRYEISGMLRTDRHGFNYLFEESLPEGIRGAEKVTVHVTLDAEQGKLTVWLNDKQAAQADVPVKELKGDYVGIGVDDGTGLVSYRMQKGADAPSGQPGGESQEGTDLLILANGDRFSATDTQIREGHVIAVLPHGELKFPAEHVVTINLRTDGRMTPRRNAGDAHVYTPRSRLTLKPVAIDGQKLVGESDYLGEVRLNIKAVRQIDFDIYRSLLEGLSGNREKPGDRGGEQLMEVASNIAQ